ncbi:Prefoldin alpha subunit [Irpex rosettiformis]|uniref:Prefoldin alpha subunit n=1 Tax=Irpex rosettiformis TaxID=378272 RepID=A0ACB8TWS6_9APHY|nr:Prefoldin alpha subunit [Irpex rosettiformis]
MASGQQQGQTINVADLDLAQLTDVRRQLEDELTHLTNSFTQLKQAQAKFKSCLENVQEVKPENKDKSVLVPLTNSLYVPGKLSDVENVIVDVGTGYYTRKQAQDHYSSKLSFLQTNLDSLAETLTKKQDALNMVDDIARGKRVAMQNAKSSSS